jgi:PAS domain S-box-containing protein
MKVGELIREHSAKIVADWEAQVRRDLEGMSHASRLALINHMPEVVDQLGEWLDSGRPLAGEECAAHFDRHALQRLHEGVELPVLQREYAALRSCILRLLVGMPAEYSPSALVRLNEAIDYATAEAVERYTEARDRSLREAEERARTSLDAADIGTWDYNPSTRAFFLSPRCKALFGFAPDEEIGFDRFVDAVHPDDWPRVEQAGLRAFDPDGDGHYAIEYRTSYSPGNAERWVFATGKAFFRNRRPVRFIGTAVDITERRRAERERDLFIGALGHDLRNPLAAISMSASLLAKGKGAPAQIGERMIRSALRMKRMIDELLVFASSQAGRLSLKLQSIDLAEVCREIVSESASANPDHTIELDVRNAASGRWDRDRLGQVVQNLVSNAVQHGDPGRPIRVGVWRSASHCFIEVTNEGPPISPEALRHLFDPFKRTLSRTGVGLGLYIVHQIVDAHRGTIDVRSDAAGTAFRVSLPCEPEMYDSAAPASPSPP